MTSKKVGRGRVTLTWNPQGLVDCATGVGLTWFAAWIFNPEINSNTVWFVGGLFGLLYAAVLDGPRKK